MEPTTFEQVRDFLFGLRNRGSRYGIGRMEILADALGSPHRRIPCIHVAGTNGKGSVCALLESALRAGGYRTGLYTSPHLVHLGERVQVDRVPMTAEQIVALTGKINEVVQTVADPDSENYPSFFEFMTAMAFLRFEAEKVDCAVLETGLGGRLDATNVVTPEVSVITSIGLDHTEILGATIEKIAAEKSGIIKPGVPVVIGMLPPEAEKVVRSTAERLNCPLTAVAESFGDAEYPETNLVGRFQRWNAGATWLALKAVNKRFPLEEETIRSAFRSTLWAGRWDERKVGGRTILFDSTHNPEGALELAENLRSRVGAPQGDMDVVVGSLGLDRARAVLRVVAPYARTLFIVRPSQPRALIFGEMRKLVPGDFAGEVREATINELFPGGDNCRFPEGRDPVLITGSIYLIGEILSRIENTPPEISAGFQDRI